MWKMQNRNPREKNCKENDSYSRQAKGINPMHNWTSFPNSKFIYPTTALNLSTQTSTSSEAELPFQWVLLAPAI